MDSPAASGMRFAPHVVLSVGFWEPRASLDAVHVDVPLFLRRTDTWTVWPAVMFVGTLCDTNEALLTVAGNCVRRYAIRLAIQSLTFWTSASNSATVNGL